MLAWCKARSRVANQKSSVSGFNVDDGEVHAACNQLGAHSHSNPAAWALSVMKMHAVTWTSTCLSKVLGFANQRKAPPMTFQQVQARSLAWLLRRQLARFDVAILTTSTLCLFLHLALRPSSPSSPKNKPSCGILISTTSPPWTSPTSCASSPSSLQARLPLPGNQGAARPDLGIEANCCL